MNYAYKNFPKGVYTAWFECKVTNYSVLVKTMIRDMELICKWSIYCSDLCLVFTERYHYLWVIYIDWMPSYNILV